MAFALDAMPDPSFFVRPLVWAKKRNKNDATGCRCGHYAQNRL